MKIILFLLTLQLFHCYNIKFRAALLDYNSSTGSLLFRVGGGYLHHGFNYAPLLSVFRGVAQDMAVPFPDDYYMVDLSLLDKNTDDAKNEITFFQKNPTKGEYRNIETPWFSGPVVDSFVTACNNAGAENCTSTKISPQKYPETIVSRLAQEYMDWSSDLHLNEKLQTAYDLIHKPSSKGKPNVVFVHCVCGCDRSGSFSGSYMMKYQQVSMSTVVQVNNYIAGREIHVENQVQLAWYCEYLFQTNQYGSNTNDCTNESPLQKGQRPETVDLADLRLWERSRESPTA